jgi:hypothetical protein
VTSDELLPCPPEDAAAVLAWLATLTPEYRLDQLREARAKRTRSAPARRRPCRFPPRAAWRRLPMAMTAGNNSGNVASLPGNRSSNQGRRAAEPPEAA